MKIASPLPAPVSFLYFDLGGILVDLDLPKMFDAWRDTTGTTQSDLERALFASGLKERLDTGRATAEQTARELSDAVAPSLTLREFTHTWGQVLRLRSATERRVRRAREVVPCGLLSNTDPLHHSRFHDMNGGSRWFDVEVVSYEVGHLKPQAAIYEAAERQAGVPAAQIAFVDDTRANVQAARARGWRAWWCRDERELDAALEEIDGLAGRSTGRWNKWAQSSPKGEQPT